MSSKMRHGLLISLVVIGLFVMWFGNSHAETINYIYDELNRLKRVEYGDGTVIEYTYDKAGNRLEKAISYSDITPPTTTASPSGGTYNTAQSVTLTCSDGFGSGCDKIYYTADGTTPTTASAVYISPINISVTTDLKFFAKDRVGNAETVKTETYTISAGAGTIDMEPAIVWVGLKNSDDQGTQFDLRAELYINDTLISEGETLCITEVTRNPSYAKEVTVPFGPVSNGAHGPGDILSLRLLTRIGTNPDGSKCTGPGGSHNNAVGLRLYYDSPTRPSGFGAEISPDPMKDYFLHSTSENYFLNDVSPTGPVKYKDSSAVNYNYGNQWKEIGTWQMVLE
jgi:YD repeat-containing protein